MLNQEQQIFEQIKKAKNILITYNKNWDGDSIASALALYLFLKKLDKNIEVIAEKFAPEENYLFLPSYSDIQHEISNLRKFIISLDTTYTKIGKLKYKKEENSLDFIIFPKDGFFSHEDIKSYSGDFKYDLIITLDSPDLESLGQVYEKDTEFFYQVPIINIDHHANNESYGQINLIEITSISTSEILFNIFSNYSRDMIDENIATCILTGIISKTKNFKTQNISPQLLSATSQLVSMGGDREMIVNKLYRSRKLNVLKLWGRVLARLSGSMDNKLIWTIITKNDFEKTNSTEQDLTDVIDELIINIPQASVIILIYESEEKEKTKALVFSVKNIDSQNLTKKWNGEGTKSIAKFEINKNIKEAELEILAEIEGNIKKYN